MRAPLYNSDYLCTSQGIAPSANLDHFHCGLASGSLALGDPKPVRGVAAFLRRLSLSVSYLRFEKDFYVRKIDDKKPWDTHDQFVAGSKS